MDVKETNGAVGNDEKSVSLNDNVNKPEAMEIQRPYTLRRLKSSDLFLMVQILSKLEMNEWISCLKSPKVMELMESFFEKQEEEKQSVEKKKDDIEFMTGMGVVVEIVNKIFTYLPKCQKEIYQLLSNVSGISVAEMEELDAEIFVNMLVDFIRKEEFKGFIKAALRLIG